MKSIATHLYNVGAKYIRSACNVISCTICIISNIKNANSGIATAILFLTYCPKNINNATANIIKNRVIGFATFRINIFSPSYLLFLSLLNTIIFLFIFQVILFYNYITKVFHFHYIVLFSNNFVIFYYCIINFAIIHKFSLFHYNTPATKILCSICSMSNK